MAVKPYIHQGRNPCTSSTEFSGTKKYSNTYFVISSSIIVKSVRDFVTDDFSNSSKIHIIRQT